MKSSKYLCFISFCLLLACQGNYREDNFQPTPYELKIPANLQKPLFIPEHNPLTEEGINLGKRLFYDPVLSAKNQISCASCHIPVLSFSDGKALSTAGVSGRMLSRHVPQLANVAWNESLFWDGGAKNLESMVFGPLGHPDEMGENLNNLTQELQENDSYPPLFKQAFGTDSVQSALVAQALAQYMRTLISADSRFDRFVRQEIGGALSTQELKGMRLVKEKCSQCHTFDSGKADFFTDFSYHNNGLDAVFTEQEERIMMGRFRISFDSTQIGAYKTPSLRNVARTAPYMHDGRFQTLGEVLEHYRSTMQASSYVDTVFQLNNQQLGIPMSDDEKEAIIAFLQSLTDQSFLNQLPD